MIRDGEENSDGNQSGANGPTDECVLVYECNLVVTLKFVVLALCLLPLVEYSIRTRFYNTNSTEIDQIQDATIETITNAQEVSRTQGVTNENLTDNIENKKNIEIVRIKQNKCSKNSTLVILDEIVKELFEKNEFCTRDDFYNVNKHKIPKSAVRNFRKTVTKSKNETKLPAIVNYAVGIVLMVSLGAALIELYRAKRQPAKKNGKNSLSRKCSLADLTVMKHHRKEMIRRESLMEVPEEHLYSKQLGRKVSRPPLRFD